MSSQAEQLSPGIPARPANRKIAGAPRTRSQQKRETAQALQDAAMARFVKDGFEATTIEDIARDAGVSRRTFFRYFPTKEELILSQFEEMGTIIFDEIRCRPKSEGPMLALRNGFRTLDVQDAAQRRRMDLLGWLIAETPALRGLMLLRQERWEAEIADRLAERLGKPHGDPVARLVAAAGYAAFRVASLKNNMSGRGNLGKALDETFDLLGEVAGHLQG